MHVVCPYQPAVHDLTRAALERYAPHAEFVKLTDRTDAYWGLLDKLWARREPFIIVEQDVEIHERAIRSLTYCPQPWCLFPYSGPRTLGDGGDPLFYMALGCTRFRANLMDEYPDLVSGIGVTKHPRFDPSVYRDWRGIDGAIGGRLRERGYRQHIHRPIVMHHHDYASGCACGTDHEERA